MRLCVPRGGVGDVPRQISCGWLAVAQEPQKNGLVVLAAAVAGALKQAAERLSTAFKNAVARSTKDIDSEVRAT